jgi:hypothetical protein
MSDELEKQNESEEILSLSPDTKAENAPVIETLGTDSYTVRQCLWFANKAMAAHIADEPAYRPDFFKDMALMEMLKAEWMRKDKGWNP